MTKQFLGLAIVLAVAAFATPVLAERSRGLSADESPAYNSIFIEGGGPGLLYSLNYERVVEEDFGLRVGVSYVSFSASAGSSSASATILAVPVIFSYLGLRGGNHMLELGGGATGIYASGAGSGGAFAASGSGMMALGTALIGYRRQPVDGGFQFRIGLEALAGKGLAFSNPDPTKFGVLPWLYMSLGVAM